MLSISHQPNEPQIYRVDMYINWKYSKIKHLDNLCCFLVLSLNNRNFHKNLIIIFIESALSVVYKLQMSYSYLFLHQKKSEKGGKFLYLNVAFKKL